MDDFRCGIGFDVHDFVEGRKLILGGVEIEHHHGLAGHSDADVATHAIIDALLGAAGLGDIGRLFPDTEEKYKGVSSVALLKNVMGLLEHDGWKVSNIDATIIAQKPRLSDYMSEMNTELADAIRIDPKRINIKATTTEKLGFAGREEGIAALATAAVYK
jgi:2-C-methyl-D-erythritol 2,4-cyclodiphosphate synthase